MFKNKTMNLLLKNSNFTPNNGAVTEKIQKPQRNLKNDVVFGNRNFNSVIPKPHYECEDYGRILLKSKKIKSALKSNNVPGPRLHYKCADCEEALGHSSNHQRYFGNPDIYGPHEDCILCGGTGCPQCPR
jgi:hypothetical protein